MGYKRLLEKLKEERQQAERHVTRLGKVIWATPARVPPTVSTCSSASRKKERPTWTHEAANNRLGSYVDLNNVIHVGPRTGILEMEDTVAEVSEGA